MNHLNKVLYQRLSWDWYFNTLLALVILIGVSHRHLQWGQQLRDKSTCAPGAMGRRPWRHRGSVSERGSGGSKRRIEQFPLFYCELVVAWWRSSRTDGNRIVERSDLSNNSNGAQPSALTRREWGADVGSPSGGGQESKEIKMMNSNRNWRG
jgi:hypothetical protein